MIDTEPFWKRCSSCKSEIAFQAKYWNCSVSTCNRKGRSYVFCSVACWDAHVPTLRHREAWAEEQRSPGRDAWETRSTPASPEHPSAPAQPPSHSAVGSPGAPTAADGVPVDTMLSDDFPDDILIVASKLKAYIRARSGLNTSDGVMKALTQEVRALSDAAIQRAREDGRKTVMDRDF